MVACYHRYSNFKMMNRKQCGRQFDIDAGSIIISVQFFFGHDMHRHCIDARQLPQHIVTTLKFDPPYTHDQRYARLACNVFSVLLESKQAISAAVETG